MAEFLDQKQAKQEGKKNLIYSHLNITNNFIIKGSQFVEFHIIHSPPLPPSLIPGAQTPAEKAYIQQQQTSQQQNQQSQQRLFRARQQQKGQASSTLPQRQFSLITYLILWSDETIQIYQILGSTLTDRIQSTDNPQQLEATLQCSYSVNSRINSVKTFRRDNNVYLLGFLEKRKMITLFFDRSINTLTCVAQHNFRSEELRKLNATCLESDLDDDNTKHNNFQGETDMNTTEHTANELVGVLISRRILALCFNAPAYENYLRTIYQQPQPPQQIPPNNHPLASFQQPQQLHQHQQYAPFQQQQQHQQQQQLQQQLQNQSPIPQPPQHIGAELIQTKSIYSQQTFYLDLQKEYDATHVIDYAIVTQTFNVSAQQGGLMHQTQESPQSAQLPRAKRIPYVFILNKKIVLTKDTSPSTSLNVEQVQANAELGVIEVKKEIFTELIVITADLQKLANQKHLYYMQQQKQQQLVQQQQLLNNNNTNNISMNANNSTNRFINESPYPFNSNANISTATAASLNTSTTISALDNIKFDHDNKHPQFKRLPQRTYMIKSLENNYILIMSSFYLFVGSPANGYFHFHCLAFNHSQYRKEQMMMKENFTGQIIENEISIESEEGLDNVRLEQLDSGRVLIKSLKKIYILVISSNQFGQIQNLQIKPVVDYSQHTQTFSARHCLDLLKNDYDIIFLNSKYQVSPYNSNIFLLIVEGEAYKIFKAAEKQSIEMQTQPPPTPQINYKLRGQLKFDNWAMIKEIAFCDKEKPQWQNYYFTMACIKGINKIYKCERTIRPKCLNMEEWFKTNGYCERMLEIDNKYYIISCTENRTCFFEKQGLQIYESPLRELFYTNVSTVAFIKEDLLEGNSSKQIFIQMTPTSIRVVDATNSATQDIEIEFYSNEQIQQQQHNYSTPHRSSMNSSDGQDNQNHQSSPPLQTHPKLCKLVYLCNTIFALDTHRNLHQFSFIQERWEKVNHFSNTFTDLKDRCIIGIQKVSPYFTSQSSSCSEFFFIGFPNEFAIFSTEYIPRNGQIRFTKRFEAHYVKEGLVFLTNGRMHMKKDSLKENLVRSITDPSIKLSYDPRETHSIFVSEYSLLSLQKSLVLVVKLNTGDIYIYKGILKANLEQTFPYDFMRQPIRCVQYINTRQTTNLPEDFEERRTNSSVTEKSLYSFQEFAETIFLSQIIGCVIISDIGIPGACITVFESPSQELFLHLMLLQNISKPITSLISSNFDEGDKIENQNVGYLIPVDGKIYFYQMEMKWKYTSSFIYETPSQLKDFNPIFMEIVRAAQSKGDDENENAQQRYKKRILIVNQNPVSNRHEIKLIDEETYEVIKSITLAEHERVYKFKTFEGTNKQKEGKRFKFELVGYLTHKITPKQDEDEEVESRFYCHYVKLDNKDPMPEMKNTQIYKDFIFDFCFLNFPRADQSRNESPQHLFFISTINYFLHFPSFLDFSDHFKVILMERDKVITLTLENSQIMKGNDDGMYHQRLMISSVWNNKQYFLSGDIQKGVQLYEMDEKTSRPRLIGEENMNMNVRQCVLFSQQNKNSLRALITDEARNVYAYSFTQQSKSVEGAGGSNEGGSNVNNVNSDIMHQSKKISMELVASFHLGSKVNKITTDQKAGENMMYDAASHLLLQKADGNLSMIQLIYVPQENTLLFDLQKTIFEELPFVGGLDPREFREIKLIHPSLKLKNAHGFFETSIVDIYFNLTRPLQERIALKLNRSRDDFIRMIIETILS